MSLWARILLSGIAAAVNGTANIGVTASVINDGAGNSYLSFTSKSTGSANTVSVSATTADPNLTALAGELSVANGSLPVAQQAQNASFTVNGVTATSSSNTVTGVIPGVTLTLNSVGAAAATPNLNVAVDQTAINKKVDDFVAAYNSLQQVTKNLGNYDSSTKQGGPLVGDSTLRSIVGQVRSDATGVVSSVSAGSNYNSLAMLGIQVDRYGVMSVDKTKLAAAVTANSNALSDVFSSSNGVAVRLDSRISSYVQAGGFLDTQTTGLNKTLRDVSQGRLDLQNRLDAFQASLQKQFTAMDVAVGTMNSTSSWLSSALSKL
ncbi:flagellar filament capping protein FliD [Methylogaea oryzae]|uniref:flagellar filament capping protein FliD n=1 Tax=Methylogaea oryzae TaxID=1295382 RepID=UPI0009E77EA4|nr:flagellar filament capping protein FliD [Methylogaea oryzae]